MGLVMTVARTATELLLQRPPSPNTAMLPSYSKGDVQGWLHGLMTCPYRALHLV